MPPDTSLATPLSREAMLAFAAAWVANWNRRDVDAVLGHFADDAVFVSPVAAKFVGRTTLAGKAAIGEYWRTALRHVTALNFTLDHATWDAEAGALTVFYEASLNGERKRACELMTFDAAGRQMRGEAFYGATL